MRCKFVCRLLLLRWHGRRRAHVLLWWWAWTASKSMSRRSRKFTETEKLFLLPLLISLLGFSHDESDPPWMYQRRRGETENQSQDACAFQFNCRHSGGQTMRSLTNFKLLQTLPSSVDTVGLCLDVARNRFIDDRDEDDSLWWMMVCPWKIRENSGLGPKN